MKFATANGWTKETIIEHIKKSFKGQSLVDLGGSRGRRCAYRGEAGAACSIGMFIPDSVYEVGFDGFYGVNSGSPPIGILIEKYPHLRQYMPLDNDCALDDLQASHDSAYPSNCLNAILSWVEKNVI